jgi:plastocyanin
MPEIDTGVRRLALAAVLAVQFCSSPAEEPPPPETKPTPAVRGRAPKATGGFPSVVLLAPEEALTETPAPDQLAAAPAVMDQYGNAFQPKVLVVRVGEPVDFENSEDVLHNVHVLDMEGGKTVFNVGTPVVGSYRHVFEKEGAYDVSCDIHPYMAAYIIVTSAPYWAIAGMEGGFEIPEVPEGAYRLSVWNLDAERRLEDRVEIGSEPMELSLTPR